jgi:hypothetical protein
MRINWHLLIIESLLFVNAVWQNVNFSLFSVPFIIVYVVYYFSKANVVRMEEITDLKEALRKNDEYAKKLTASLKSSSDQIKVLNKKVADLTTSVFTLSKKSLHRPLSQPIDKKLITQQSWHQPEFAMKPPTESKPAIMPRRQSTNFQPRP